MRAVFDARPRTRSPVDLRKGFARQREPGDHAVFARRDDRLRARRRGDRRLRRDVAGAAEVFEERRAHGVCDKERGQGGESVTCRLPRDCFGLAEREARAPRRFRATGSENPSGNARLGFRAGRRPRWRSAAPSSACFAFARRRLPAQAHDRAQRTRKPRAVAHDADIGRHNVAQFVDDGVIHGVVMRLFSRMERRRRLVAGGARRCRRRRARQTPAPPAVSSTRGDWRRAGRSRRLRPRPKDRADVVRPLASVATPPMW